MEILSQRTNNGILVWKAATFFVVATKKILMYNFDIIYIFNI